MYAAGSDSYIQFAVALTAPVQRLGASLMADLNPQPLPPRSDRIRVFVPHEAAYDLQKMNKITASVLAKLGCGGCHSGRILDFVSLHDFVVHPKTLEVSESMGMGGL
jgi:hypothetical protein